VLPNEVLHLVALCKQAQTGDREARRKAVELDTAMKVLSTFDVGIDLVLYFKYLMVLRGNPEYALQINPDDALTDSQKAFATSQLRLFEAWYADWSKTG
jgi:1-pyrroline-4-hydroxy-2-carboxylate deaminase